MASKSVGRYFVSGGSDKGEQGPPSRLVASALAVLMILAAARLLYFGRDLTFVGDEWAFINNRRDWTLDAFLVPHNEHLVLFPAAVFKLLFPTVGLTDFWVYLSTVVVAHLVCVALLFRLARHRVGDRLALLASLPILFLGSAWQVLLWSFNVGFVVSVAAGLGMLLMLDRGDRRGDAFACLLLSLSLASASIGLPFAAGAVVEVLLRPRRLRRLWVALVPLSLYALWYVAYGPSSLQTARGGVGPGVLEGSTANLTAVPAYAAKMAATAFGGLAGLRPAWGGLVMVVALAVALSRLLRVKAVPVRFVSLGTGAVAYWVLTALTRAHFSPPSESRYVYLGAVLIVLMAVEIARGVRPSRPALAVIALLVGLALVGNASSLAQGARDFQVLANFWHADMFALEVARPGIRPDFPIDPEHAPELIAGPYYAAVKQLGSPADKVADFAARPDPVRQAADSAVARALGSTRKLTPKRSLAGAAPVLDAAHGGMVSLQRTKRPTVASATRCLALEPRTSQSALDLTVPQAGIVVTTRPPAPVSVFVRRLADRFPAQPFAHHGGGSRTGLLLPRGRLSNPWHVRLATASSIQVCGLAK